MKKMMYRAYDKTNKMEVSFSHESDAKNAVKDGWIDGYEAFEYVEPPGPTPEELLATEIRAERDAKLMQLDIAINRAEDNGDFELSGKLRKDRQALRDVPQQEGFPEQVQWPDSQALAAL